jgi:TonB family protein
MLLLLLWQTTASAQHRDSNPADRLFKTGYDLMQKGEFREADSYFVAALKMVQHPMIYYNHAMVRIRLGDHEGFCRQLHNAIMLNDSIAPSIFRTQCMKPDTTYYTNGDSVVDRKSELASYYKIVESRIYGHGKVYETTYHLDGTLRQKPNKKVLGDGSETLTTRDTFNGFALVPDVTKNIYKYFGHNQRYPEDARERRITGFVEVSVLIGKDGRVEDVLITEGLYPSIDAETRRIFLAAPKWVFGDGNGKLVRYNFPVRWMFR